MDWGGRVIFTSEVWLYDGFVNKTKQNKKSSKQTEIIKQNCSKQSLRDRNGWMAKSTTVVMMMMVVVTMSLWLLDCLSVEWLSFQFIEELFKTKRILTLKMYVQFHTFKIELLKTGHLYGNTKNIILPYFAIWVAFGHRNQVTDQIYWWW